MDYGRSPKRTVPPTHAAQQRMKLPSCEKCRHLRIDGAPECAKGHELALCSDFKDASRSPPPFEGGITRIYRYGGP